MPGICKATASKFSAECTISAITALEKFYNEDFDTKCISNLFVL